MSSTYSFGIYAFGCTINLTTECPEVYLMLERYVFPPLPRRMDYASQTDICIRIAQAADQFQLFVDDVAVASAKQAISLVPDLTRALDDAVIPRLTTLRAIHAGAVLLGGRALLLPGATHAGKSSLVAELLRRGATYFSDEYALIDLEGYVHPYPRPLLVRNGCPEQFPMLVEECNATIGDKAAPVGWIVSLEYMPEGRWNVAAVPQSEALLNLLRNTPHVLAETPDMIGVFQCAVAGAACYAGYRSEAAEAANHVLQLTGGVC